MIVFFILIKPDGLIGIASPTDIFNKFGPEADQVFALAAMNRDDQDTATLRRKGNCVVVNSAEVVAVKDFINRLPFQPEKQMIDFVRLRNRACGMELAILNQDGSGGIKEFQ